jgi:hypothetical protein
MTSKENREANKKKSFLNLNSSSNSTIPGLSILSIYLKLGFSMLK